MDGTCPNCGYCPHCKRRNLAPQPYPWIYPTTTPWPAYPYWSVQSPTITTSDTGNVSITPTNTC